MIIKLIYSRIIKQFNWEINKKNNKGIIHIMSIHAKNSQQNSTIYLC